MTGAAMGAFLGPVGAAVGALAGAVIGGVAGAAAGGVTGMVGGTIAASLEESNKELGVDSKEAANKKTDEIAKAMASGKAGSTREDLEKYLIEEMKVLPNAASDLADRLWENADELRDYGESVQAAEAANESYYSAMATNAQ